MTQEEYELIFGTPDWLRDWQEDYLNSMAQKLDAEIMGHPVIISPIVPEDEIWFNDGEKIVKIKGIGVTKP